MRRLAAQGRAAATTKVLLKLSYSIRAFPFLVQVCMLEKLALYYLM
jgi:hypothetical protein